TRLGSKLFVAFSISSIDSIFSCLEPVFCPLLRAICFSSKMPPFSMKCFSLESNFGSVIHFFVCV
ncbi:hypothetical protein KSS87_012449, partial [Heliosperma pusillum]